MWSDAEAATGHEMSLGTNVDQCVCLCASRESVTSLQWNPEADIFPQIHPERSSSSSGPGLTDSNHRIH